MNPDQIANRICRLLDAGADDLPPHIQARLSKARGVALSRLAAQQARATPAGGRQRRTARGWSWAGLPPWARLGAATAPVLLAALLVLPNLGQRPDNAHQTTAQNLAPATSPPIPANLPDPAASSPGAPTVPDAPTVLVATDPTPLPDDPFEAESPFIIHRYAFTPAPGMAIPVAAGTGNRFHRGYGGGFTRVSTGTPVSFTMPITPNPAPPLSSFDPTPSWGAGR